MAGTNIQVNTLQSNIKKYNSDFITNYSLFLGGLNATQKALEMYDPLKTGYARIFFIKMPVFMEKIMPSETKRFRHLLVQIEAPGVTVLLDFSHLQILYLGMQGGCNLVGDIGIDGGQRLGGSRFDLCLTGGIHLGEIHGVQFPQCHIKRLLSVS